MLIMVQRLLPADPTRGVNTVKENREWNPLLVVSRLQRSTDYIKEEDAQREREKKEDKLKR